MKYSIDFYYREWRLAEKEGKFWYAEMCKERYRLCVMSVRFSEPYYFIHEKLKQFPVINLN